MCLWSWLVQCFSGQRLPQGAAPQTGEHVQLHVHACSYTGKPAPPLAVLVGSYALKVVTKRSRQEGLVSAAITGNRYQEECPLKNYRLMVTFDSEEFRTSPHAWEISG